MIVRSSLLFLLSLLYTPTSAWSQWSPFSIPPGGFQGAGGPCVDSNHNLYVYAPGTEQFHKYDFSSKQWMALRVDSAIPTSTITASICLPNGTMVVAGHGIFRSSDAGAHWTKEWTSPTNAVNALAYSPQGVLLAVTNSGVYITDATDTLWSKANQGLPSVKYYSVFAAPNGYYFAASSMYMYRSTDSGKTWNIPDSMFYALDPSGGNFVQAMTVNDEGVLLAGGYRGVYQSSDSGESWSWTNSDFGRVTATNLSEGPNDTLYATTNWRGTEPPNVVELPPAGSWRSTDKGMDWDPMPGLWGYRAIAVLNVTSRLLAGITDEGVFESSDRGDHWFPIDSGISTAPIYSVEYHDGALFAGLRAVSGLPARGILRSSDNGMTWPTIDDSLIDDSYDLVSKHGRLYAAGTATLFQWDGNVWHPLPQFPDQTIMTSVCADTNGTLFAGNPYSGVLSLPNNAEGWTAVPELFGRPVNVIACDSENILYALVADSLYYPADSLFVSSDDGSSWNAIRFPESAISIIAANNDTLYAVTADALYRSRDRGMTWTTQPFGLRFAPIGLAFHGGLTFVYNRNKVWETASDTSAWQVDLGFGGTLTSMTIADNNIAYLGTTANGIYSRSLPAGSSGVASEPQTMDAFEILQTPYHLTIISGQATISLRILNILGNEVLTIHGSGTLEVDLTSFAAGTYFAVIQSGNAQEVRRIAVVH